MSYSLVQTSWQLACCVANGHPSCVSIRVKFALVEELTDQIVSFGRLVGIDSNNRKTYVEFLVNWMSIDLYRDSRLVMAMKYYYYWKRIEEDVSNRL